MSKKSTIEYADSNQKELWKKFPSTHYLSNPTNVDHVLLWSTFFRRNLHRFAIDYLGIKLHLYQAIILYFMGISKFICIIACRAAAKSFIIAIYCCCRCILYPGTKATISSATKGQAKLIVSEKIKNELMQMSPVLRAEIATVKDNQNDIEVIFRNTSTIKILVAGEGGRGNRATTNVREEFRLIPKSVEDSVISPYGIIRQPAYMLNDYYAGMIELQEDPIDIYISSSWLDNGHWMWDIVDQAYEQMMNDDGSCLLAFDESVTLKHNIRTRKQLVQEQRKQDPLTWRMEFLNERVKENASAFFTYTMLTENQRLKQVIYPRTDLEARDRKKNKWLPKRQDGELRVLAVDMAFVTNSANDNSVYSLLRLLPEVSSYVTESGEKHIKNGFHRSVPFITAVQGGDTTQQALAIRRLFEDFECDYLVLDTRNGGLAVLDMLQKVMYDELRNCEYSPIKCMNNEGFANRNNVAGKEVIYAVNASAKLNSDIAFSFRTALVDKKIDFLVSYNVASEDILPNIKEYVDEKDLFKKSFFDQPFWETQAFVAEAANLQYEKMEQTGIVKISEQGNNRKDRYTSVSYGNYFADLLETDLLQDNNKTDFSRMPICASSVSF